MLCTLLDLRPRSSSRSADSSPMADAGESLMRISVPMTVYRASESPSKLFARQRCGGRFLAEQSETGPRGVRIRVLTRHGCAGFSPPCAEFRR